MRSIDDQQMKFTIMHIGKKMDDWKNKKQIVMPADNRILIA